MRIWTICGFAVLAVFASYALADKQSRFEEAVQIAVFSDKVSRQGNKLLLRLGDGTVVTKDNSRPSAGYVDCDGNVSVNYRFLDFIAPWYVIHEQYYEGGGTLFVNRDTGEEKDVDGVADFAPDKSRFISWGYPGVSPCHHEVWKLSQTEVTREWQTECYRSLRWADPTTIEITDAYDVTATLKHDGTSWKCSGAAAICGTKDDSTHRNATQQQDPQSNEREPSRIADAHADLRDDGRALCAAAQVGNVEVVKVLLDQGADINATDWNGRTGLRCASEWGKPEAVRLLLMRGADANAKAKDSSTALMSAARRGYTDVARALLENGADPNAKDEDGRTAVMWAASYDNVDAVNVLLEKGADVNAKTKLSQTALMMAERTKTVRALLQGGADADARDWNGETALLKASERGHLEVVRFLLDWGVDPNAKDQDGRTPMSAAAKRDYMDLVRLLRERGAKETLIVAARAGDLEEVKRLIDKGAEVNAKDDEGTTALIEASDRGNLEIVRLLLENGADVNAETANAWTALICAAFYGHLEIVKALLDHGADTSAKNDDCHTASDIAKEEGHNEIAALLEARGAK